MPPKIVKSCEKTKTLRPRIVPWPVTTASPHGPPLAHAELDLTMPHVAVELDEGAGVEQPLEPLACEQLALRALPLDRLLRPLVERVLAQLIETLELGLRRVLLGRHAAYSLRPGSLDEHRSLDHLAVRRRRRGRVRLLARRPSRPASRPRRRSATLDGGHALLFASGHGGRDGASLGLLRAGQTVALAEGAYYGIGAPLPRARAAGACRWSSSTRPGRRRPAPICVWIEAPSNPFLTFPGPRGGRSASGAGRRRRDRLDAGAPAAARARRRRRPPQRDEVPRRPPRRPARRARLQRAEQTHERLLRPPHAHRRRRLSRRRLPPAPQPADARAAACTDSRTSALELATRLAAHPAVERVRYPGLGPDPLAAALPATTASAALLSFDVRGDPAAVERSVELIANATSLGGVHSTLESRRRWEGERVPEGLIRLSVGARGRRRALGRSRAGARAPPGKSRRRDSNPRPAVYKTAALPAELLRRVELSLARTRREGDAAPGRAEGRREHGPVRRPGDEAERRDRLPGHVRGARTALQLATTE